MSTHPTLYDAGEVATILGVTTGTLATKWRRLHRDHGFPRPIPGRSDAWSRILVDEWVATPHGHDLATGNPARRRAATIDRQREALEARYAGGLQ